MKKFIPYIVIVMWSLLVFVGYNVLTVEATTESIKEICVSHDGKWKDNECKFEDGIEMGKKYSKEQYQADFDHYIADNGLTDKKAADEGKKYDSYEEYNEIVEPICKEHGGKIDYGSGECMFKNDARNKAINFEKELDDRGLGADYTAEEEASWNQKEAEEKAADEDAICDDEDADTTDIKLCMSDRRQQQAAHNYDKESCEQVNGDWNKKKNSGCTFYEDEQQDILDTAEEQRKIIDEEEQKALAAIDEYNALQAQAQQEEVIEDWGNTVTPDTNNDNEITPEEAESYVASTSDEEEEVADNNEEDDNQVNTDTEDSSDNTHSADSQDSSDSEDNSSDDGGDSSDSGDDSSSSDDGGDSGESSESEE